VSLSPILSGLLDVFSHHDLDVENDGSFFSQARGHMLRKTPNGKLQQMQVFSQWCSPKDQSYWFSLQV
jgi:hypothetical protein